MYPSPKHTQGKLSVQLANCKFNRTNVAKFTSSSADIIIVPETQYNPNQNPSFDALTELKANQYLNAHSLPYNGVYLPRGGVGIFTKNRHKILDIVQNFHKAGNPYPMLDSRLLRITLNINNEDNFVEVIGVYAPNNPAENSEFIQQLHAYLAAEPPLHPLLIGGDWNAITHPQDAEKLPQNPTYSEELADFPGKNELTDCFRHLHPIDTPMPYPYTNKNGNATRGNNRRIDQLFCSNSLTDSLISTQRSEETISSHYQVFFHFKWNHMKQKRGTKRYNPTIPGWSIYEEEPKKALMKWTEQIIQDNTYAGCTPVDTHMTYKSLIHGRVRRELCIPRAIAHRQREKQGKQNWVEIPSGPKIALYNIENRYNPTPESKKAALCRVGKHQQDTTIECLINEKGTLLKTTKQIIPHATKHFENTFKEKVTSIQSQKEFANYIAEENKLTKKQTQELETPFTLEELEIAVFQTHKNKANGPDGIPFEFYQELFPVIKEHLLKLFNYLGTHGVPTHTLNRAYITLVPKKGKEATDIANWRPISLMNTDMKIYSHLINNRVKLLTPQMIHPDQSGFVYKRVITTNLDTLDQLYYSGRPWTIGLIDFAKAFDSLSHSFIQTVLTSYGFGPIMLQRITALQTNANSMLLINNQLSPSFPLLSGVRQGDPLSPFLFVATLEPLLIRLRGQLEGLNRLPMEVPDHSLNDTQTHSYTHFSKELVFKKHELKFPEEPPQTYKLAAYADDIAIFFNSPEDIVNTGKVLTRFKNASALAINPKKTIIQDVPGSSKLSRTQVHHSTTKALQTWEQPPTTAPSDQPFKYLGIHFGPPEKVRQLNLDSLEALKTKIRNLPIHGLDPRGKTWILSSFIIPKINYQLAYSLLQTKKFAEVTTLACDKVNGRLTTNTNGKLQRRQNNNNTLTTPTNLGGYGLLDLSYFAPNTRLVRAARVLSSNTPAKLDLITQFHNHGAYTHLTHNPLLAFSLHPCRFVDTSKPAALKRGRQKSSGRPQKKLTPNNSRNAFCETKQHLAHKSTGFPSLGLPRPQPPKGTVGGQTSERFRDPSFEELFLPTKKHKKAADQNNSTLQTETDTLKTSTSISFRYALETMATFIHKRGTHLQIWEIGDLDSKTTPHQLHLFNTRQQYAKQHPRQPSAYPSIAEIKYFSHHIQAYPTKEDDKEKELTPITPKMVKHVWREHYPPLWHAWWRDLFLSHNNNDIKKATEQWTNSCGNLFSVYCQSPKLGVFLQELLLQKLHPVLSDWDEDYPYFKNVKKGCGICNKSDFPEDHKYHKILTHILCECPIVQEALSELTIDPMQDLSSLAFSSKRIKDPDKLRLAYGTWHFERGLRRLGRDGQNRSILIAFERYLSYLLNPGSRLVTFSQYQESPQDLDDWMDDDAPPNE